MARTQLAAHSSSGFGIGVLSPYVSIPQGYISPLLGVLPFAFPFPARPMDLPSKSSSLPYFPAGSPGAEPHLRSHMWMTGMTVPSFDKVPIDLLASFSDRIGTSLQLSALCTCRGARPLGAVGGKGRSPKWPGGLAHVCDLARLRNEPLPSLKGSHSRPHIVPRARAARRGPAAAFSVVALPVAPACPPTDGVGALGLQMPPAPSKAQSACVTRVGGGCGWPVRPGTCAFCESPQAP